MDTPKNCLECEYGSSCAAGHYGAYRCVYAAEIDAARNTLDKEE